MPAVQLHPGMNRCLVVPQVFLLGAGDFAVDDEGLPFSPLR